MTKPSYFARPLAMVSGLYLMATMLIAAESPYLFNRAPLAPKPYTELPLGTIQAQGWLQDELQRMAAGMSGHLDEWYPEVCGDRNAWLGGDGDTWERGPYWIDGLYPLARLLGDKTLQAKAQKWIDWTLTHQRADGYIGPVELKKADRTQPPPKGAQIQQPDDWWPRMVMLKILQQHHLATGDQRVVDVLHKYFRYQLKTLPDAPLHDPKNPKSGSWWAAQRGGDNLMVVLWFYNLTGEKYLLELANLIYQQTIPVTEWLEKGEVVKLRADQSMSGDRLSELHAFHCVNLAQAIKTPLIRFQQDGDSRHLAATRKGFEDIRVFHGLPHGLYGGDEGMHGRSLDRGSELCSAVEMMFSLEKMLEITGEVEFGDRLEKIAFNILPTQSSDDHHTRQYFSQANQVQVTMGDHGFFNDGGDRLVYGLLQGYPCCTCNLHQGWPKFVQHLWMASADHGLAALAYGPSRVQAKVANGIKVTITEETLYPFAEEIRFTIEPERTVEFPLHLRIPGWCVNADLTVNGEKQPASKAGSVAVLKRAWKTGDHVALHLPMTIQKSDWEDRSIAIERGPLLYALRIEENWSEVNRPAPPGVPANAMHRGYRECKPTTPWNYALLESSIAKPAEGFKVVKHEVKAGSPWNLQNAPLELHTRAVRVPEWTVYANSAGRVPLSPLPKARKKDLEDVRLIPYGCTTLRISAFPWIKDIEKK